MNAPTFTDMAVVGMHFREREGVPAKAIVANFIPPVSLDFEREPSNQFDSNAIKILYVGQHIGYLEASSACYLAPWIDDGHDYKITVTDMATRRNNLHPIVKAVPADVAELESKQAALADA
jgi:hypothetical protein